jgi:putative addiction module component (TIGR02574 family)
MTTKVEQVLKDSLSLSPSERALIAHCLIASIESTVDAEVEAEWIQLADRRLKDIEGGKVKPIGWDDLKKKVKSS